MLPNFILYIHTYIVVCKTLCQGQNTFDCNAPIHADSAAFIIYTYNYTYVTFVYMYIYVCMYASAFFLTACSTHGATSEEQVCCDLHS